VTGARWELLRALGAIADSPADARAAAPALGLDAASDAEHTDVFVMNCPPYGSVYLGPDGALGGEGADRAAGFWHALGLTPPAEPDHLTTLLSLYASLGEAAGESSRPVTAAALARSQAALFWEHLWPWLPGYLDAVTALGAPALAGWAELTRRAIAAEYRAQPEQAQLPLALRAAPAGAGPDGPLRDLVAALTTPVRSGIILTRRRLAAGAGQAGVGHRIGERRYTLRAMLEQDPPATLTWLSQEAQRWEQQHARRAVGDATSRWWAGRAAGTAVFLRNSAAGARARASAPAGAGR
jgi:TorA maturation chaperone TorD